MEGEPTSSNTVTPSRPVEPVAEESTPYPNQTGSGDSDFLLFTAKFDTSSEIKFHEVTSVPADTTSNRKA